MITFKEFPIAGYKARTKENTKADVTLAIAKDFTTAGEILTKNSVISAGNVYAPIHFFYSTLNINYLANYIASKLIMSTLNIAGNGIYTLKEDQNYVDYKVFMLLCQLFELIPRPQRIISGGQTGIDEAGLKAAVKLNIPAVCLAPKGWIFRDINGVDISDEQLFKQRFK